MLIKKAVQELGNIKQKLEELRRMMQRDVDSSLEKVQRSYSEAANEKKEENIIISIINLRCNTEENKATKKLIKEKINIARIWL